MRKKKKISQNRPIETLRAEAAKFLSAGKYKEAIEAYKRLIKRERSEEWQTALAKAYLLRAQALADKNMYKEAVVLWENRSNLCADKEGFDQYIDWLIRANRYIYAAQLINENSEYATRQLHVKFGALLLAGITDLVSVFSEDSPLIKQHAIIKAALQAYTLGDNQGTEEYLKKIPFRSPYRDFSNILKALLIIDTDPTGAHQLLGKVSGESPYLQFAEMIKMSMQQGYDMLSSISHISMHERAFLASLKGWDKAQIKIISMLKATAKRDGTPKVLLEVIIANYQSLGENYSRQFCHALLPSYPGGIKVYERVFGPLSTFDSNRIAALNAERQGNLLKADKYWRLCVTNISSDKPLHAAVILRHLVEIAEQCGDEDEYDVPVDLAESLRLDPDDKASYLKLIEWYKDDKRGYNKWVDAAIKHFPKDSEILLIGMEAAIRKKAFKKAVRFAKTLLKVDPINIKARNIARDCHISHARKLTKSGKYELARKELKQAEQFEKTRSGVIQINHGLLELQAEGHIKPIIKRCTITKISKISGKLTTKESKGFKLLEEGIKLDGSGIRGHFRVIIEFKCQSLEYSQIKPLLSPLNKKYLPTRDEILELSNLINIYFEEGITFIADALEDLKQPLQNALKLDFSQDEMLSLCQCFKNVKHHGLLKKFADHSLKHWPNAPAFIYYQIYSKAKGYIYQIPMTDFERLHEALEAAEQQGDKRAVMMIIGLLNQIGGPPFHISDNFEEELEGEIEAFNNMDPEELIKIINRFNDN